MADLAPRSYCGVLVAGWPCLLAPGHPWRSDPTRHDPDPYQPDDDEVTGWEGDDPQANKIAALERRGHPETFPNIRKVAK